MTVGSAGAVFLAFRVVFRYTLMKLIKNQERYCNGFITGMAENSLR